MTINYFNLPLFRKDGLAAKHVHVGALDLKQAPGDDGSFEGHGSVFGTVDSYNEIVAPGAFKASLAAHKKAGTLPAMLWQHNPAEPIGSYTEMKEDDEGLFVKGRLELATQRGGEAHALLRGGALRGLSIGYMPEKFEVDEETGLVTLTQVDLWEVSVVTFAANPDAQVEDVKSIDDMTKREFEAVLRDEYGFSHRRARRCASAAFGKDVRDERVQSSTLAQIRQLTETMNGD